MTSDHSLPLSTRKHRGGVSPPKLRTAAVEVQHDHGVLDVHHFDQYMHPGGHIDGTYHMQPPGELEMTVLLHNLERFVDVKVRSHLAFLQPSLFHTLRINSLQRVT